MESQVSEISPVQVEVKVEIPWDRVKKDLDDHYRQLGRQAKVKGFRPGKVPPKVVKQLFGSQVKGEVTSHLVEQGLLQAVTEHELQIVAQPEVEAGEIQEGQPLTFTAKMEIRPSVEEVDLSELEVAHSAAEVGDEAIQEEIDRLRQEHAEVRVPEPMRPAKDGDELTIDYTVSLDGEPKEDMGATDRPVELGADRLLPEFEEGLGGLQPGDEKEITVEFPDDHGNEDLQGKTAVFTVKVKELRERLLPEVDDEFAKDVGDYETLLELRLDIRKRLESQAERRSEAELKEALIDKLVEINPIPVPPSMVHQEESRMAYEFAAFMQMAGQQAPPMSEELHQNMHERAERKVRAAILLGALARQQGLEVGDEDVEKKLQQIAEQTGKHVAKVKAEHQGERREQLESQLLEEKLMDYLRQQARIVEAPAGGAEEEASEAASSAKGASAKKGAKKKGGETAAASAEGSTAKKKAPTKKKAPSKKSKAVSEQAESEAETEETTDE